MYIINFKILDKYTDFYFVIDLATSHQHIIEVAEELEIEEDYHIDDSYLLIQYDYVSPEQWLYLKKNKFK